MPSNSEPLSLGIVTASDRASEGLYEDRSGPAIESFFQSRLATSLSISRKIVPDDKQILTTCLQEFCDKQTPLIITTGGTGPAPRDITPEITEKVCDKILPGFGEEMRRVSMQYVPTAILSRQVAGICNKSLIVNLPGSPKAIDQCLSAIFPAIVHGVKLISGFNIELIDSQSTTDQCGSTSQSQ